MRAPTEIVIFEVPKPPRNEKSKRPQKNDCPDHEELSPDIDGDLIIEYGLKLLIFIANENRNGKYRTNSIIKSHQLVNKYVPGLNGKIPERLQQDPGNLDWYSKQLNHKPGGYQQQEVNVDEEGCNLLLHDCKDLHKCTEPRDPEHRLPEYLPRTDENVECECNWQGPPENVFRVANPLKDTKEFTIGSFNGSSTASMADSFILISVVIKVPIIYGRIISISIVVFHDWMMAAVFRKLF